MKILFLIPNNILGGAEQYLKMIAEYYKNEDVDIVFFNKMDSSNWENISKITSQRYFSHKNEIYGIIKYFFYILFSKKQTYDYIFSSHVSTNAFIGLMLRFKILKTKNFVARESTTVFTRFSGRKLFKYKMLYKFGYNKIDLLICQTNKMKSQLIEYFPKINRKTKVVVIPNPISKSHILEKSKMNINTILPDEFLVSAGRLIQLKGFDLLIECLFKLKKQYPNLKLIILGKGKLEDKLKSQAKSLGITDDVIFSGHVNNVYPYFTKAKICVVSSRIEGFPNVLLQMMSQNNNIVSTTCAGDIDKIPNIIKVKPGSSTSLYEGILENLKNYNNQTNNIHSDYLSSRDISNFIVQINREISY